ncbi:unnamed protein product [Caenorhabditis brenneri]
MGSPECKICYFKYQENFETGTPRILNCGHTFCEECIQKVTKGSQVECPTCRKATALTNNGVKGLSKNYALIESIEEENKTLDGQKIDIPCAENAGHEATIYCVQCKTDFCERCFTTVHKPKLFSDHQKLPISEKLIQLPKCEKHPDNKAEYICKKENCPNTVKIMCHTCILTHEHKSHTYTLLIDQLQKNESSLKSFLENFKTNMEIMRIHIEDYENCIKSNDVNGDLFCAEYKRISKEFDEKKQEALDSLVKHANGEITKMESSLLKMRQELMDQEAFESEVETKLKQKNDFLNVDETLKTGEEYLKRMKFESINNFDDFTFKLTGGMDLKVDLKTSVVGFVEQGPSSDKKSPPDKPEDVKGLVEGDTRLKTDKWVELKDTVFVQGISASANTASIAALFSTCGNIAQNESGPRIKINSDKNNGGECMVTFVNANDAQKAIKMYNGRPFSAGAEPMRISLAKFHGDKEKGALGLKPFKMVCTECTICCSEYQDDVQDLTPRILTCGHTFCAGCVKNVAGSAQTLKCPTCRSVTTLNSQGVKGLPKNFSLLDSVREKQQELSISEKPIQFGKCKKHPESNAEYICKEKSCSNLIKTMCITCAIQDDHRGHAVEQITDHLRKNESSLKLLSESFKNKIEIMRIQIEDYKNCIKSNDVDGEVFRAEYNRISQQFDKKKQEALDSLVKHANREITKMEKSLSTMKQNLADSEAFESKLEKKIKLKNDFMNIDDTLKAGNDCLDRIKFKSTNKFGDFAFELTQGMDLKVDSKASAMELVGNNESQPVGTEDRGRFAGDRGGLAGDRGGFTGVRGGFTGVRGGFAEDRGGIAGGFAVSRGAFRGDRGGVRGGDRGGFRGGFRGERGGHRMEQNRNDWSCGQCGNNNFAFRREFNQCHTPKTT